MNVGVVAPLLWFYDTIEQWNHSQELANVLSLFPIRVHSYEFEKSALKPFVTCEKLMWSRCKSSPPEVFLGKKFLKICTIFTGEHPYRSVILINLQSSFIEITLRHVCSPVNLLNFSRTSFPKNTSGRLLLTMHLYRRRIPKLLTAVPVENMFNRDRIA